MTKITIAGLGVLALAATLNATPASAQTMQPGTWTGEMTPPGGEPVPVTFEVTHIDGAPDIVMSNPDLGGIPFLDERIEGDQLIFWWEPGTRVDCTLVRQEDGSFHGTCSDGRGSDGGQGLLTMRPPGA